MKKVNFLIFRLSSGLTLKSRLLITYLCLSGFILFITAFSFYTTSKQVLIKNAVISSEQQLSIITNNLSEKIGHITDYAITLSINSELAEILKENPTVPTNSLERFFTNSALTKQAQRIIGLHKNIYQWDILDTENQWFHSSTSITEEITPYLSSELLDSLSQNPQFYFLGPVLVESEPVFMALKPISDIDTTRYLGTVVLLIKESNISSAFQNLPDSKEKNFYILDSSNRILSSTDSAEVFQDFSDFTGISSQGMAELTRNNTAIADIYGEDTLVIRKAYPGMDWHVINMIPIKELNLEHWVLLKQIIFICILLFVLSFMFSVLCAKTVTAPIQKLASKMQSASQGNLNITASYHSKDEISILYNQFNSMMKKIHSLLDNIYVEQNAKQEMEIKLLQSQISPHFLYNTLNMIKSLIELDMADTAIRAISALSGFYRNSLSKGSFIISLKQVLELTKQYLYIESLRFMEYIDYEVSIDTNYPMEDIKIPKLTLQPLIENIFVHALTDKFCHISISLREEGNNILITVQDNGMGISSEKLEKLTSALNSSSMSEASFGIPSIHQRIRLLYGSPYGLHISSSQNSYTSVTILLPKKGGEIHENNRTDR